MNDIRIESGHPTKVRRNEWRAIQAIQRDALAEPLGQSVAEELVLWRNLSGYLISHHDQNDARQKRFDEQQQFYDPWISIARDYTRSTEPIVGFAYLSTNVSGRNRTVRATKRQLLPNKNYIYLREVAVEPSYQRQHVGTRLVSHLLHRVPQRRKVTAYTWPDQHPAMVETLEAYGFSSTGDVAPIELPGQELRLSRFEHPRVDWLLEQLNESRSSRQN